MGKEKTKNNIQITINDIATAAGVSISTVSKVMNGTGSISRGTKEKINNIISELDYRPNELARSLHQKKTYTIGLLSTDDHGRFSIPILKGIESALAEAQISVFLCNASGSPRELKRHVDSLLAKRVDGIIVTAAKTDTRLPLYLKKNTTPVVYAYSNVDDQNEICILPDDMGAGKLVCHHLIEQGCRSIVQITGPDYFMAVNQRIQGCQQILQQKQLSLLPVHYGRWTSEHGYRAMQRILNQFPEVDGVIAGNDLIGHGVLQALNEAEKLIPADIAVVSFDNWQVITDLCHPLLSSVDFQLTKLGKIAGECLIEKINDIVHQGKIIVPCYLQSRASSIRNIHHQ